MVPYPRSRLPVRPGQVLILAPAAFLGLLGLTVIRNGLSRPVVRAEDAPGGGLEALVHLRYASLYPFWGDVEGFLEVRRLPDRSSVFIRPLGRHRWASQAIQDYRSIEWSTPSRITVRSAEGGKSHSVLFNPRLLEPDASGAAPEGRR